MVNNMVLNETLKRQMEKNSWNEDETEKAFADFVKESFPEVWGAAGQNLANLDPEDYDFFSSSWEITTNRRKGSGGKGEVWVGMLVGYDGERDTMQRQRDTAVSAAEANISQALRYGIKIKDRQIGIGRAFLDSGKWKVANGDDTIIHSEDVKGDAKPRWAIPLFNGTHICLLKDDKKSPKMAYMPKRTWFFIGNKQSEFFKEGPIAEILPLECSFGAADVDLKILRPISFKAEMEEAWTGDGYVLKALDIEPTYGLEWVPEEMRATATKMFSPDQYLATTAPVVDLNDAMDFHMKGRKMLQSGKDFGPLFVVSGVVDYVDHDGKAHEWTDGGFKHSLTLTSQSLRREDPNAQMWIDVSRTLVADHEAFKVKKADGWHEYAKGSRVWVVVRSRTWESTTGDINLNMDAKGVYAMPLRSIVAPKVDDNISDLGHLDQPGGY